MPTPPHDLDEKRADLIRQFKEYQLQVSEAFDGVLSALNDGRFAEACSIMLTISRHQGQASVGMRTVLVKNGFLVREKTE
jgi:hypothetical protein